MALISPSCRQKKNISWFPQYNCIARGVTSSWIKSWSRNICFWLSKQKVLSALVILVETWQCKLIKALLSLDLGATWFASGFGQYLPTSIIRSGGGFPGPFGTLVFKPHHKGKQVTLFLPYLQAVSASKPQELIDGNRFQENLEIPVVKILFKMYPVFLAGES